MLSGALISTLQTKFALLLSPQRAPGFAQDTRYKLMQDLAKEFYALEATRDDPSSWPLWALDPTEHLFLRINDIPPVLQPFAQAIRDNILDLLRECGFTQCRFSNISDSLLIHFPAHAGASAPAPRGGALSSAISSRVHGGKRVSAGPPSRSSLTTCDARKRRLSSLTHKLRAVKLNSNDDRSSRSFLSPPTTTMTTPPFDLEQVGRLFNDTIAVLRDDTSDVEPEAMAWLKAARYTLMRGLEKEYYALERSRTEPLKRPGWALDPACQLILETDGFPALLAPHRTAIQANLLALMSACGFHHCVVVNTARPMLLVITFPAQLTAGPQSGTSASPRGALKVQDEFSRMGGEEARNGGFSASRFAQLLTETRQNARAEAATVTTSDSEPETSTTSAPDLGAPAVAAEASTQGGASASWRGILRSAASIMTPLPEALLSTNGAVLAMSVLLVGVLIEVRELRHTVAVLTAA
ncbi:hypothetical protein C8R46DRAFT_1046864 [Mycena filopes]|nr:hypothetical protein C8R46DRAFT_1046864 [Mycena filopes]